MADDSISDESHGSLPLFGPISSRTAYLTEPKYKDHYQYQVGFGNSFASEAM